MHFLMLDELLQLCAPYSNCLSSRVVLKNDRIPLRLFMDLRASFYI